MVHEPKFSVFGNVWLIFVLLPPWLETKIQEGHIHRPFGWDTQLY